LFAFKSNIKHLTSDIKRQRAQLTSHLRPASISALKLEAIKQMKSSRMGGIGWPP
jgi:hypothetical protein